MVVYSLYILNKAGGLIFHEEFVSASTSNSSLKGNQYLTMASTFHGLHAIAKQFSPFPSHGIEVLEADSFKIQCYSAPSGSKFFLLCDLHHVGLDNFLKQVYDLYADYVMKNPFYETEMPIRATCELFVNNLRKIVNEGYNKKVQTPQ